MTIIISDNLIHTSLSLLFFSYLSMNSYANEGITDVIYLSTVCTPSARSILDKALSSLLSAVSNGQDVTPLLYQLYYEQGDGTNALSIDGNIATFSSTSQSLAFDDSILDSVYEAWKFVNAGSEDTLEYMTFEDREAGSDDELYE
jgi:hypothetical protein